MAERLVRQLIDDLDRTEITDGGGERLEFGLRQVRYRIDLTNANVAKFERALAPYLDAATKLSPRLARTAAATKEGSKAAPKSARKKPSRRAKAVRRSPKGGLAEIRSWARESGFAVSERGRIAATVIEAFNARETS